MPTRRRALKTLLAGAAAFTAAPAFSFGKMIDPQPVKWKGNIRHSVCRWCYGDLPLDTLCAFLKKLGIGAVDRSAPRNGIP